MILAFTLDHFEEYLLVCLTVLPIYITVELFSSIIISIKFRTYFDSVRNVVFAS